MRFSLVLFYIYIQLDNICSRGEGVHVLLEKSEKGFGFHKESWDHRDFCRQFAELRIKDKQNTSHVPKTVFLLSCLVMRISSEIGYFKKLLSRV